MKKRIVIAISIIIVFTMTITACSGKKANSIAYDAESKADYGGGTAAEESLVGPQEAPMAENGESEFTSKGTINNSSAIKAEDSTALQSQDKIIRTFYLDVETQEFDSLITKLDSEISRLNGYVENSKVSGRSFYDREGARYASITARVPKDKVDEFVNTVGESANVVNKQESTENVTLQYADIESRKKALEIEQERLFVLLEKADNMENIVTLESRLSDIRYELQNYETTLRTYDNKVEYSTVTLSIQEVEKLTPSVEIKQTVGTRIKNGFSNTMYRLSEGFKNFVVWFVVNLPYLLIWAVIITAVVLIGKRSYKKRIKKNLPSNPPVPPEPPTKE